tara:strand:- start:4756 stop:5445 length:690 start_codon:yes stop_codon:yes gene_type:complete
MKSLVFDTGPLISITMNNLLWVMKDLKKKFNGRFLLAEGVRYELVDKPLKTKSFKFEALQTLEQIREGVFEVVGEGKTKQLTKDLMEVANSCFTAHGRNVRIIQYGEMSALALLLHEKSEALVVDERTTRLLIEHPARLHKVLRRKLHANVKMVKPRVQEFQHLVHGVKVIRSIELMTMAYELGFLDRYLAKIKNAREELVDAFLWGLKIDGCAISKREIDRIKKIERK